MEFQVLNSLLALLFCRRASSSIVPISRQWVRMRSSLSASLAQMTASSPSFLQRPSAVFCIVSSCCCTPMECFSNAIARAISSSNWEVMAALTAASRERGFGVHDVPGDSNWLFSAIAYQLESINAGEMREIVANHLEINRAFTLITVKKYLYCWHWSPYCWRCIYNDPQQQIQVRWEQYIHRLRNGAWGDHLAIQCISNELNIAINMLSSEHSNMEWQYWAWYVHWSYTAVSLC